MGIGNLLLADEGVGVHVARALLEAGCPEGVTVVDVGTAILDALPEMEDADRIIVVDAVKADKEPGTIYRMPFDHFESRNCIASMHGFDLSRVLALTRQARFPEVLVIGIEPARIDWSLELSARVAAQFPVLVQVVRRELDGHGQAT